MELEIKVMKQENLFDEGKYKYYLKISKGDLMKIINIGEQTYNDVNKLITEAKPIEEKDAKPKK